MEKEGGREGGSYMSLMHMKAFLQQPSESEFLLLYERERGRGGGGGEQAR